MFSNSNSYLGGGNTSRPSQPSYSQPQFPDLQQGQQQPNGFASQPTGLSNAPSQQQHAGFPPQVPQQNFQAQQQQPPQYPGQSPQSQQASQQPPFQTGQALRPQVPQNTGQTSSQIAQSFSTTPANPPPAAQAAGHNTKIPKIRLSFLTAQDQAKFEQLFKSAVGDAQALDGTVHTAQREGR